MTRRMRNFTTLAQGNSMYPLLQDGDVIEYIHASFIDIKVNDIILIYKADVLMTHRVIFKNDHVCITRGDNNIHPDKEIKKGQIVAKAARFNRKGVWYGIQDVYIAQSGLYIREINKLTRDLKHNKIKFVFLKGVMTSLLYEGIIPRRIYSDCDILIERKNFTDVKELFLHLGYKMIKQWNVSENTIPEINFIKVTGNVPIVFDVHLEPHFLSGILGEGVNNLYPYSQRQLLTNTIIKSATQRKIQKSTYSFPSPPMQIVCLALHIFHHNYTDSIRFQLLDIVIRKSQNKKTWEELKKIISIFQFNGYLFAVFVLAKNKFKTPFPQSFITDTQPSFFKRIFCLFFLKRVDIFSQESRVKAGIKRFILIFLLSPEPLWKKILLFFHKDTIQSIVSVIGAKANFFIKRKRV